MGNVAIGTADGLIDGAIAGMIFAWLYNAVMSLPTHTEHASATPSHNSWMGN
jgi:hypothetical protein